MMMSVTEGKEETEGTKAIWFTEQYGKNYGKNSRFAVTNKEEKLC